VGPPSVLAGRRCGRPNYPSFKSFNFTFGFVAQTINNPTMNSTTPGAASFIFDSSPKSFAVQEVEPATPFKPKMMPPIIEANPKISPSFP
jgi:hypothetical protein